MWKGVKVNAGDFYKAQHQMFPVFGKMFTVSPFPLAPVFPLTRCVAISNDTHNLCIGGELAVYLCFAAHSLHT